MFVDTLTITAKVKILPSEQDIAMLAATMAVYRDACNFVAEFVFKTHERHHLAVHKALYNELRHSYGLKSQMACSVIKTVLARYDTIFTAEHKWIKPVFKKQQYDLVWNRDYSLTKGMFSVNTLGGRLKVPFCSGGMEKYFDSSVYRFGTAKLVKKHGKYFLHIPVTYDVSVPEKTDIVNIVGIDRGINFIVATYDSQNKSGFVNGRGIKQKRAHYKELRKQLQQVHTPSSRRRLKAIGQRENRWMHDVNHCISKALVCENPKNTLFVLEDLTGIRSATERVRLTNRYETVSWSFYDLEQKLMYKAKVNGSLVIKVDPRYTSQTCPVCGHVEKGNRDKKNHVFCCKHCGYQSNDDRIGAMNLYRKGKEFLVPDTVAAE